MNSEIAKLAKWAMSQGWTVADDAKGYTRFWSPAGDYIANYSGNAKQPAPPANRPHSRPETSRAPDPAAEQK